MNKEYQVFYPNQYSEAEKAALDRLKQQLELAGGIGPNINRTVKAETFAMLEYARIWDPYNPLFNQPGYAAKTKWGNLPSAPCYIFGENITGFPMMDEVGDTLGNVFYYANDGGEIELYRPVFDGDEITFKSGKHTITDTTDTNGSILRQFTLYGEAVMTDSDGNIVGRGIGHGRNAVQRITAGEVPSEYEQTYEWIDYMPSVHITTEEEWDEIKTMWRNEVIRGKETRWWNDVQIGDRLTPVCSGPISDIEMIRLHSDMITHFPAVRDLILAGEEVMTDSYGQKLPFLARHYSYCRNAQARAVFYNFTARNFILRMITNWIGDDGFLCGFKWRFQNLFACMSDNEPGKEFLSKVPSMSGKFVNRHGMEGDTAICKGEVTEKVERDGKYYIVLSCWAETFDHDIIQVVEATVELPLSAMQ
jgi:hypothetical protein